MLQPSEVNIFTLCNASEAVSCNEYLGRNRISSSLGDDLELPQVVNASLRQERDLRGALWAVLISALSVLALLAGCCRAFTKRIDSRDTGRRLSGRDTGRGSDQALSELLESCLDVYAEAEDSGGSSSPLEDGEQAVFRIFRSIVDLERQLKSKDGDSPSVAFEISASHAPPVASDRERSTKKILGAGVRSPSQAFAGAESQLDNGLSTHPSASISSRGHDVTSLTRSFVPRSWTAVGMSDEAPRLRAFWVPGRPDHWFAPSSSSRHHAGPSPRLEALACQTAFPLRGGLTYQRELPAPSLLGERRVMGHRHNKSEDGPPLEKRQKAEEELEGKARKKTHSPEIKNRRGTHAAVSALAPSAYQAPAFVEQTQTDSNLGTFGFSHKCGISPKRSSSAPRGPSGSVANVELSSYHLPSTSRDQSNSSVLVAERTLQAASGLLEASPPPSEVEISLPEPAAKQSPTTHPDYRLPLLEDVVRSTFAPECISQTAAFAYVSATHLADMRALLDMRTLPPYDAEQLIRYAEEVARELATHHRSAVQHKQPANAVYILGRRYVLVEALFCAVQVLGLGPMRAEEWWCELMRKIATEYTRPIASTRMRYRDLAVRLSEALRSLQAGKRPSEEDTVSLRTSLFRSEDCPPRFKNKIWDNWRRGNRE